MSGLKAFFDTLGDVGIKLLALVLIALVAGTFVRRVILRLSRTSHITTATAGRLLATLRVVASLIVVLAALQITGVFAEAWAIISATLAALAVGFFALWSVLSNVTSALILLMFRPFRVDDEIEVLDSDKTIVRGKVVDLNLMFTTIVDDKVACRVPNNFFLQRVVRVTRRGVAPNPSDDMSTPFF